MAIIYFISLSCFPHPCSIRTFSSCFHTIHDECSYSINIFNETDSVNELSLGVWSSCNFKCPVCNGMEECADGQSNWIKILFIVTVKRFLSSFHCGIELTPRWGGVDCDAATNYIFC